MYDLCTARRGARKSRIFNGPAGDMCYARRPFRGTYSYHHYAIRTGPGRGGGKLLYYTLSSPSDRLISNKNFFFFSFHDYYFLRSPPTSSAPRLVLLLVSTPVVGRSAAQCTPVRPPNAYRARMVGTADDGRRLRTGTRRTTCGRKGVRDGAHNGPPCEHVSPTRAR
jgi:hypothetical protein